MILSNSKDNYHISFLLVQKKKDTVLSLSFFHVFTSFYASNQKTYFLF